MDYLQYRNINYICSKLKFYVLNLVINGLPSICIQALIDKDVDIIGVLNLVINGLPSISSSELALILSAISFKPCYKWITFNIASVIENITSYPE